MNLTPYEVGILLSRTPLKVFSLPDVCIDVFLRNNLVVACEEQKFNRMQFELTDKARAFTKFVEKCTNDWIYVPKGEVIIDMEVSPFTDNKTLISEEEEQELIDLVIEPEDIVDKVLDMVTDSDFRKDTTSISNPEPYISKYQEELPCDVYGCEEIFE